MSLSNLLISRRFRQTSPDDGSAGEPILSGGPEDGGSLEEAPAPGAAPKPVFGEKVVVGGQEYEVEPAVAAALRANEETNLRLNALEASRTTPPVAPTPTPEPEGDTWEDLIYTNPKAAKAQLYEELKTDILSTVTTAYTADKSADRFWQDFYSANKDLTEQKFLVDAVLNRDMAELKDLPSTVAATKLAEKVKLQMGAIAKSAGTGKGAPDVVLTPGAPASPPPAPPSGGSDEKVVTLSSVLRDRSQARREAAKQVS